MPAARAEQVLELIYADSRVKSGGIVLKRIDELLAEGLVLVLGAGASKSYGFPDWNALQTELAGRLQASISDVGLDSLDRKYCEKWTALIDETDFSSTTIDHVISQSYRTLVERHWIAGHIKEIIATFESRDADSTYRGWIETFGDLFIAQIDKAETDSAAVDLVKRFKVITLNYDRCFDYHFFGKLQKYLNEKEFADRDFLKTHERALRDFFLVYHPHGSLGFLSLPDNARVGNPIASVNTYDGTKYSDFKSNSAGSVYGSRTQKYNHIELVGEGDMRSNYKRINEEFVTSSVNCIVLGISEVGLKGCKLNWGNFDNIFYSGSGVPSDYSENFQCLGMYANEIVSSLAPLPS